MGITQNTCGEDTVQAIVNLGLARGYLGREGCGLMPIRGHSGVQGGAEMGAYATAFPGGIPINAQNAARLSQQWGFAVPDKPGLSVTEMLEAARKGQLDVLWSVGGNFLEVLPSPKLVEESLSRVPLRIHQDIVLSSQMLVEGEVILLPAMTRYEIPGGVSETSTERRVIFSPEIPGPRIAEARWEGRVLAEVVARCKKDMSDKVKFENTAPVREEIARIVPQYKGIQELRAKGDSFQYGGPHLCQGGVCPTPDGRANFKAVSLPIRTIPEGAFRLVTRRGKQFNSMVHESTDPINGAPRNAVMMNQADVGRLGLQAGQAVFLYNDFGSFAGVVFVAPVKPGSIQLHWPEGNHLLDPSLRSAKARIPAYKEAYAFVQTGTPYSQDQSVLATD